MTIPNIEQQIPPSKELLGQNPEIRTDREGNQLYFDDYLRALTEYAQPAQIFGRNIDFVAQGKPIYVQRFVNDTCGAEETERPLAVLVLVAASEKEWAGINRSQEQAGLLEKAVSCGYASLREFDKKQFVIPTQQYVDLCASRYYTPKP